MAERWPTFDELNRLLTHCLDREKHNPNSAPMAAIIAFVLFPTRRLDEITRIVWTDLDESASRVWVRDMKHPGEKEGNDVLVDIPPEALRIIQAQPRKKSQIFPFKATSISTAFTRACAILGIQDLHFHDLRQQLPTAILGRVPPSGVAEQEQAACEARSS
jgi:integrase